jgi:hypothetical protein
MLPKGDFGTVKLAFPFVSCTLFPNLFKSVGDKTNQEVVLYAVVFYY